MKTLRGILVLLAAFVRSVHGDTALDHFNRGVDKAQTNDLRGAIAEYTKAIELKPDYANAYVGRGTAKYGLKDNKGAVADYTVLWFVSVRWQRMHRRSPLTWQRALTSWLSMSPHARKPALASSKRK